MSQQLHEYHYHYLYSYEKDRPVRLTDTKIVTDETTGVTIFHHNVYTVLYLTPSKPQTRVKGNIYQLDAREHQAIDGLLHLNNVACHIAKPTTLSTSKGTQTRPTKPTPPEVDKKRMDSIQLISGKALRARLKSAVAQRVSAQAVMDIEKRMIDMERMLKVGSTLSLGRRVYDGEKYGTVVGTVRRPQRMTRWRVEWDDDGGRESFYAHNLKPLLS